MAVRYHSRKHRLVPDYLCNKNSSNRGAPPCQFIPGAALDQAVGKVLVETMTPVKLELALAVQQEIDEREAETHRLYGMQVERARYESTVAERRYKAVDPDNRLVAGTLESEWNGKLRLVREAEQEQDRLRDVRQAVTAEARKQILRLAEDVRQMWQDSKTPDRERKRIARLLVEDVTLIRGPEQITAHIRFKGGAAQTIPVPLHRGQTDPQAIDMIERLSNDRHDSASIAEVLNRMGIKTARGKDFTSKKVQQILHEYQSCSERPEAPALPVADLCVARGASDATFIRVHRRRIIFYCDSVTADLHSDGPHAPAQVISHDNPRESFLPRGCVELSGVKESVRGEDGGFLRSEEPVDFVTQVGEHFPFSIFQKDKNREVVARALGRIGMLERRCRDG